MSILYVKPIKAQNGKKTKIIKEVKKELPGDLGKDVKGATRLKSGGFGKPYEVSTLSKKDLRKKKRASKKNYGGVMPYKKKAHGGEMTKEKKKY